MAPMRPNKALQSDASRSARLSAGVRAQKGMTTFARNVAAILFLFAPIVHASNSFYVYFDLSSCKRVLFDNEPIPSNQYRALRSQAGKESIFHIGELESAGFCTEHKDGRFTCRADSYSNFPLAGATYQAKSGAASYHCAAGCSTKAPAVIFRESQTPNEVSPEREAEAAKFQKVCHGQ